MVGWVDWRGLFRQSRLFELKSTPKAFANFRPAVGAQRQPWVSLRKNAFNPERVYPGPNPFRVRLISLKLVPELSLRSNSGLKLANAFGVSDTFTGLNGF